MQTDTLIVGGGLAGLALASRLEAAGHDYVLVEARGRFGGRVLTSDVGGLAVDMGPAWFWPGQLRMAALADRFGFDVFEQFANGDIVMEDQHGSVHRGQGYASMAGSLRVAGGLGQLTDALAGTLPASRRMLDATLRHLAEGEPIIATIETPDGAPEVHAVSVVLALPPRVAATSISYAPPLDARVKRLAESIPTWMAGQAKILAVYDQPYWRNQGLSGDAMSRHGPMVEIHDASPAASGPYALFGFVGVPPDVRLSHREAVVEAARAQLVRVFGDALADPLAIELMDWAHEPLTAIAADHASPGYHPDYGLPRELTHIWDGRLLLGSTETGRQFGGYLEGALEAADNIYMALARDSTVTGNGQNGSR